MKLLPLLTLPLAILLTTRPALSDVYVVDDDGPADFSSISAAVSIAGNGDAILVRPGTYSGFSIQDEGLKVLGDGDGVLVNGIVQVQMSTNRVVTLSGLTVRGGSGSFAALELSGGGKVRVHSCHLIGSSSPFLPGRALIVDGGPSVVVTGSTLQGGSGTDENAGRNAVTITSSEVALYGCTVRGGDGDDQGTSFPVVAGRGGNGIDVTASSFLFVSGSSIRGGKGGDYLAFDLPGFAGDGGDGVMIQDSVVRLQAPPAPLGGAGGEAAAGSSPGFPGDGVVGSGYAEVPGAPRTMLVGQHWSSSGSQTATFEGLPGDMVFVVRGESAGFAYEAALSGVWTFGAPSPPGDFIGTLPASGLLTAELDLGVLAPGQTVQTIYQQAYFVEPGGSAYLGTPDSTVFLALCGVENYCTTSPNSAGPGALMGSSGSTSLLANDLTLLATGSVPHQFGVFFYGPQPDTIPFGDGIRCVSGGSFRLPATVADAAGTATFQVDSQQPPMSAGPGAVEPGSVWYFQFWYRDPAAGGGGFNLSDGLEISFCP